MTNVAFACWAGTHSRANVLRPCSESRKEEEKGPGIPQYPLRAHPSPVISHLLEASPRPNSATREMKP